jgi:hypothetical protein
LKLDPATLVARVRDSGVSARNHGQRADKHEEKNDEKYHALIIGTLVD